MTRLLAAISVVCLVIPARAQEPVEIGSRRELFVDEALIDKLSGDASLQLRRPTPREVVLVTDKPWEGNTCAYYTLFRDGDLFRMYYRGSHWDEVKKVATHPEVTCYAESRDGIHWTKPNLGLYEWAGSKANNIVWNGVGTHCFTPFRDDNPDCPADARYKAVSRGAPQAKDGLYVFQSPDAIHWKLIRQEPVITQGAFDSQNLAFWDPHIRRYREYHRTFVDGVRAIMTSTSTDFVNWTKPTLLKYSEGARQHLYTNAIRNYVRAPHILLGFPTRYLPKEASRVEPVLMASRDGVAFRRWPDAVIPEDAPEDRRGNRSNYMAWGVLQLPGDDRELSVYGTEAYYTGPDTRLRRFVYRLDGFAAAHADQLGEVLTKPLTIKGGRLELNVMTGQEGSVRVEIQDASGKSIEGFALDDCEPLTGDRLEAIVKWKGGSDTGRLEGRPIRIRFAIRNADLYSWRFANASADPQANSEPQRNR